MIRASPIAFNIRTGSILTFIVVTACTKIRTMTIRTGYIPTFVTIHTAGTVMRVKITTFNIRTGLVLTFVTVTASTMVGTRPITFNTRTVACFTNRILNSK